MYPRLALLRELLAPDGTLWVSMDDNEAHYLKVLLDKVFGRGNFVVNVLWQKRASPDARPNIGGPRPRDALLQRRIPAAPEQSAPDRKTSRCI
jgi:hypothetical protein